MIPDPEYTIKELTVYRLVGPDGQEVDLEDDHGSYPLDFESYADAFDELLSRTKLPFHGPLTKVEQDRAEANRALYSLLAKHHEYMLRRMATDNTSPLDRRLSLPANSGKTITFYR